ncbi:MAG: TldD/PmbA family protein [Candidatus Marinimicrobia bacterium]|nr:TldD/PmbA family protein [Candidatus Neomarinimicrobiota bacterium]MBT6758753.1 TldD/PmbA family protein [Candidatus Neomarinimicrobiota bacterium]
MEKNVYLDLGYWVQKKAKQLGANQSALGIRQSRSVSVDYRDGKVETLKESTQQSLWIEIFSKGRYSNHSTNDLRKESLEKFIANAIDLTGFLEKDKYRKLPDPEQYKGQSQVDLDLNDVGQADITGEERQNRAKELGVHLEGKDERLISVASGFSDYHSESYQLSSNGFEGHQESTSFAQSVEISLQGKGDKKPEGGRYYRARHLDDLVGAEQTANEALARTQDRVGAEKIATETMPLLLENSNAAGLFWRLMRPLSAASIQQKNSFLADRKGQKVGSDLLTITDEPSIVRGLGSRYYDGDGLAAKSMPIFTNGVLNNYYTDVYYGNKLGWTPNAGGSSNLIVKPGMRSGAEIEASLDRAILVTNWLGGNANSTTGDFSLGVAGWLIENGKRVKSITEMNISGNYNDLLMNLIEVGNDPWIHSSFRTPTMVFDKVSFSGS